MRGILLAILVVVGLRWCQTEAHAEAPKDPDTALLLTLGADVLAIPALYVVDEAPRARGNPTVPIGLAVAVLAPSAGHWYAHDLITYGMIARILGMLLVVRGLETLQPDQPSGDPETDRDRVAKDRRAMILLGSTLIGSGMLWDFANLKETVADYNKNVQIGPVVGGSTIGIAIGGRW